MSNGADQAQQPPENTTPPPAELKSRKRASPGDDTWLPPGWRAEVKVRTSGTKAGIVDKFYYEPITNRKFRSKNEVQYYLEHGTPKKTVKKTDGGLHSEHSEGRGNHQKQTKSKKKANEQPPKPLNFDFLNVPDKVIWTGTKGPEEAWWPSIGDYKIQESVSRDWDRAFTFVSAQNVEKPTTF